MSMAAFRASVSHKLGYEPQYLHPSATPENIGFGIVFVHAVWSGPSAARLMCWAQLMKEQPEWAGLLHVIDTDALELDEFVGAFGSPYPRGAGLAGGGETFWVQRGNVVDRLGACAHVNYVEQIRAATRRLTTASIGR